MSLKNETDVGSDPVVVMSLQMINDNVKALALAMDAFVAAMGMTEESRELFYNMAHNCQQIDLALDKVIVR